MIPFSPKQDVQTTSPNHKLHKTCDGFTPIHVLSPLALKFDKEMGENVIHNGNTTPNASDSEYEYVDVDKHLSNEFSQTLILAPRIKQSDLQHKNCPCLDLVIAPSILLNIVPMACFSPS